MPENAEKSPRRARAGVENISEPRASQALRRKLNSGASSQTSTYSNVHQKLKPLSSDTLHPKELAFKFSTEPSNFARGEQSTPLSEGVHGPFNSKAHYVTRTTIFDVF